MRLNQFNYNTDDKHLRYNLTLKNVKKSRIQKNSNRVMIKITDCSFKIKKQNGKET